MDSQFIIPHEVLKALKWMMENDVETFQSLIDNYVLNNLNLGASNYSEEEQHNIILDFFMLIEDRIAQTSQVNEANNAIQKNLMPFLNNIDTTSKDAFNNLILATSANKAQTDYANHPEKDPKGLLCKELLKRWKPSKKISIN